MVGMIKGDTSDTTNVSSEERRRVSLNELRNRNIADVDQDGVLALVLGSLDEQALTPLTKLVEDLELYKNSKAEKVLQMAIAERMIEGDESEEKVKLTGYGAKLRDRILA